MPGLPQHVHTARQHVGDGAGAPEGGMHSALAPSLVVASHTSRGGRVASSRDASEAAQAGGIPSSPLSL